MRAYAPAVSCTNTAIRETQFQKTVIQTGNTQYVAVEIYPQIKTKKNKQLKDR